MLKHDTLMLDATELDTPMGPLTVVTSEQGLHLLSFTTGMDDDALRKECGLRSAEIHRGAVRHDVAAALRAFFAGDARAVDGVPVVYRGTDFQESVWRALRAIPAGTTASYQELAAAIGRPTAVRAVARANATNRIAIVVPCHRVIGADGSLRGYAAGVERKAWLLRHEAEAVGAEVSAPPRVAAVPAGAAAG